jgi:uncharacterized protein YpmB
MKKINYKKLRISDLFKVLFILIIIICLVTLFSFKKFQSAQIEAKSKTVQESYELKNLQDVTRIEGIGVYEGYAYFIFRKRNKNILGKISILKAVEVK